MNSDLAQSSEETLEAIASLLSRERLLSEVDQPIDRAAHVFQLKVEGSLSHSGFNRVIEEFVRHIYHKGLRLPHHLSDPEALAEAVSLLERYYQGIHTRGYDGALLDGVGAGLEGIELVLSRLAESIKDMEQEKYVNWVFLSHIDQLDWEAKQALVSVYLKKYEEFLPPNLVGIDPARLVDHLRQLILDHVSTNSLFNQIFGANESRNP